MSKQPTGRPRGRPVGSGAVLEREQIRLTVRLPATLYDRLEAYAESLHYTRGTPELASVVRDALEHWLTCPQIRQTGNGIEASMPTPFLEEEIIRQTGNCTISLMDSLGQIGNCKTPGEEHTADVQAPVVMTPIPDVLPEIVAPLESQPETPELPPVVFIFDSTVHKLSDTACPLGHTHEDTGQCLRYISNRHCCYCTRLKQQQRKARIARGVKGRV